MNEKYLINFNRNISYLVDIKKNVLVYEILNNKIKLLKQYNPDKIFNVKKENFLLKLKNNKYVYIGNQGFNEFDLKDEIIKFYSPIDKNNKNYPIALSNNNIYLINNSNKDYYEKIFKKNKLNIEKKSIKIIENNFEMDIYKLCDKINLKFIVKLDIHNENYKINDNKISIINNIDIDYLLENYNNKIFNKKINKYSFSCFNSLINIYKIRKLLAFNYDNIIPYISSICNNFELDYFDNNKNDIIFKFNQISIINKIVDKYDCFFIANNKINNNYIDFLNDGGYIFSINMEQKEYEKNGSKLLFEGIILNNYLNELNFDLIYVYRKINLNGYVSKDVYDKDIIIDEIFYNNKKFNVIREDKLIGGTKQRIGVEFLENIKEKNIFYRGPVNGYAQVALAYSSLLINKKFHIILNKQKDNFIHIITKIAMLFGAKLHQVPKLYIKDEKRLKKQEEDRVESIMSEYKNKGGSYLIPLGLKDKKSIELYSKTKLKDLIDLNIKRLWITVSTGLVYDVLYNILLTTKFNVVFVSGKKEGILKERTKYYISKIHFRELAKKFPPYVSEKSYDAKMWEFIEKYGENEDYIFNVGGINRGFNE